MTPSDPLAERPASNPLIAGPVLDRLVDTRTLPGLRPAVALQALRLGVSPARVHMVLLVVSELVDNAITHGGGAGRIRVWRSGREVFCEVKDAGPGLSPAGISDKMPGCRAAGGRGLPLCRELSDGLVVRSGPSGSNVTVWFEISDFSPAL